MGRRYDVGSGFVRAKECPDCFHTRCGEDCVCNCDAAHAEHEAAWLRGENERLRAEIDALRVELVTAQHVVGEAWFRGGKTLAEAIETKCRKLEDLCRT